jgi:hypothetical protein
MNITRIHVKDMQPDDFNVWKAFGELGHQNDRRAAHDHGVYMLED